MGAHLVVRGRSIGSDTEFELQAVGKPRIDLPAPEIFAGLSGQQPLFLRVMTVNNLGDDQNED